MNALFREVSKPCGWSGGNTPTSQPAVGKLNSAPSLGRQKMIEPSWFCGRMRVRSNLSHRLARVRAGCFAYVHATVVGGSVSHHHTRHRHTLETPVCGGFFLCLGVVWCPEIRTDFTRNSHGSSGCGNTRSDRVCIQGHLPRSHNTVQDGC